MTFAVSAVRGHAVASRAAASVSSSGVNTRMQTQPAGRPIVEQFTLVNV